MILGITGKTSVGKTTAANFIKKNYNAWVADLDSIAKELYQTEKVKNDLKKAFGNAIFNKNNEISLKAIKKVMFNDQQKWDKLNKIMLPHIRQTIQQKLAKAKNDLKVIDGAILFQAKLDKLTDQNILIDSTEQQKRKRNIATQKFSEKELTFILKKQEDINSFKKKINFTIKNNDSVEMLNNQVKQIFNQLKADQN